MDATHIIRDSVTRVAGLRHTAACTPGLAQAVSEVKRWQAQRFSATYVDFLQAAPYQAAARFFLEELYSEKDYATRDAQFARIASALERLFPRPVVQTAVSLAQLHCLTEELDMAMGQHWLASAGLADIPRYIAAWRTVGQRAERLSQLSTVLQVGLELDRLTRTPGLRLLLKMMSKPAHVAGLGALQKFLELGFDTFAAMGNQGGGARYFLDTVQFRESQSFRLLFDAPNDFCESELAHTLAKTI
jgi:hypothetical protein